MRQAHLFFVSITICAWVLAGCNPIDLANTAATESIIPTGTIPSATAMPTLTPEEQAALNTANAYLGDKIANLRFENIRNIGAESATEYRVYYRQVFQQIPVWAHDASVIVQADGEVSSSESYDPHVSVASTFPSITLDAAVQTAAQYIGIQDNYVLNPNTELVIYPTALSGNTQNNYVLAWHIVLKTQCPEGDWNVIVNAVDNTMLFLLNTRESPKPLDGPCATPLPLPTLTAGPPTAAKPSTPTPAAYPPPATSTASGYPAPTIIPEVISTSASP